MDCTHCNKSNPDGHKFCGHCGQALSLLCRACGFANEPGHKFCGDCGASLTELPVQPPKKQVSEAERRQLTVMFCDLVGSTAMSEIMDPEDLSEILSTYQESCKRHISRYGGYIARYMGDGLLVYFGYPHAHERDPERAVRAGLDIVADIGNQTLPDGTPLFVRIGIATGQVVVGDLIGEGASEERAVLGETPNLAARLQALAEPGTVVVSEATRGLLAGALAFDDLGPQTLKGISGAVHAYRAAGEITDQSRTAHLAQPVSVVGRQDELAQLQSLWQRAVRGHGQVVTVIGDTGFGKTHLVAAFRQLLADPEIPIIEIRASEFHPDSALRPVRQMLEASLKAFDAGYSENPSGVLHRWLTSFPALMADVPVILHDFLGIAADPAVAHNLDAAALKARLLETLLQLHEEMAARRPQVMVFEDVQWLDPSTSEFMSRLVSHCAHMSTLLIITFHPSFSADWKEATDIHKIILGRLSGDDAAQMIDTVAGSSALSASVRRSLIEHADGIPLYVEELTRSVVESGAGSSDGSDIAVPTSLQDSLMARLDRLGPTKLTAQKAAVIGRVLDQNVLHALSQTDGTNSERGLLDLLSAGLLIPRTDLGEGLFEFRHALVRDIAYQSLLIRRRKEIHNDIAEAVLRLHPATETMEPETLAFHFGEAGRPERALPLWRAAASKATARWANVEAISYYRKALAALAKSVPDDSRQTVELLLGMTGCMRIVDRFDEAFAALEQAEALATTHGFEDLLTRLYALHGNLCFPIGDLQNGVKYHTRSRDLARKLGAAFDEAKAESGLGDAGLFMARFQSSEDHYNTCIEIARREKLPDIEMANLSVRGHIRLYLNKFADAQADCLSATDLAAKAKNRRAEMIARGSCLAKVTYELGDWQQTDEQAARALEIAESLGARRYIPMYICFRAKAAIGSGQSDRALDYASRAVEINRQTDFMYSGPMTLGTLARAHDRPADARKILDEGEALLQRGSLAHNHFWYRLDAMELGLKWRESQLVADHAAALEAYTASEPAAWATFHIQRCRLLARIADGSADDTVYAGIKALLVEATGRKQKPAADDLKRALEQRQMADANNRQQGQGGQQ